MSLISLPRAVHTSATLWRERGRRAGDVSHVTNIRPTNVEQHPARPFDWSIDDVEVAGVERPAHGIERPAS